MGFPSVLTMAQRWVAEKLPPGSAAIDATAGGGVDTLFLARQAGPRGRVLAFDVQLEALARTRQRLEEARAAGEALAEVTLVHAGHERMAEIVPADLSGRIRAVMFNLGYLPGSESPVITRPETTLPALEAALRLLAPGGILTAVLYPGHPGGLEEAHAVERWMADLPASAAQTVLYRFPQRQHSPCLAALIKAKNP